MEKTRLIVRSSLGCLLSIHSHPGNRNHKRTRTGSRGSVSQPDVFRYLSTPTIIADLILLTNEKEL